jgi:hypothetical protein
MHLLSRVSCYSDDDDFLEIEAYGGITYTGYFEKDKNRWWLGVDFGHGCDIRPIDIEKYPKSYFIGKTFKGPQFVFNKVTKLAQALYDYDDEYREQK